MLDFRKSSINSALRKVLKRFHYPLEVMLTCVRWYVAYPLSLRHIEEMMQERGVFVDHATVHRWAIKMVPVLAAVFRRRKHPVGKSWRMDETYIKVASQWKYLYRSVDRAGDTVDFLLTAKRDMAAARRFLERAINLHDLPEKITIDKSGANTAAIESVKADARKRNQMCLTTSKVSTIEPDATAIWETLVPRRLNAPQFEVRDCLPHRGKSTCPKFGVHFTVLTNSWLKFVDFLTSC